jgi:hypothetical protein
MKERLSEAVTEDDWESADEIMNELKELSITVEAFFEQEAREKAEAETIAKKRLQMKREE